VLLLMASTSALSFEPRPYLRQFYSAFSTTQQHEKTSSRNALSTLQTQIAHVELYEHYTKLCNLAVAGDREIRKTLRIVQDNHTNPRPWIHVVNEYLCHQLQYSYGTPEFQRICQKGKSVALLVDRFSMGILAFFPPRSSTK
jgi:hypothetical protein